MHYYTSPSTCASKKTLGHIDCNKVTDVEPITSDEQLSSNNKRSSLKRNSVAPVVGARFDIHTQERIYHLMAPSQGEMLHWVGSLSNLISSLKKEQIRNENTFIKKREVSSDSKQVRSQIGNRASLILSRPSSEVAPTPPSPQRFEPQETFKKVNVEEVVIFLERVSSRYFFISLKFTIKKSNDSNFNIMILVSLEMHISNKIDILKDHYWSLEI